MPVGAIGHRPVRYLMTRQRFRYDGDTHLPPTERSSMRLLIALFLPWLTFFTIGRPIAGVICLILQITLLGWLPATIWAVYALSQYKTDQKIKKALGAKTHNINAACKPNIKGLQAAFVFTNVLYPTVIVQAAFGLRINHRRAHQARHAKCRFKHNHHNQQFPHRRFDFVADDVGI